MYEEFSFGKDNKRLVYIRPVSTSELPDGVKQASGGNDVVYSVNSSEGEQLAIVADRDTAYFLARENEYTPVSVH